MKRKKSSLWKILPIVAALSFIPLKSKAQNISGHVGDMLAKDHHTEQGESLPDRIGVELTNLNNDELIFETNLDNGEWHYTPNSVIQPNFNINRENISKISRYDINGRLEDVFHGNNIPRISETSGMKILVLEDMFGNKVAKKGLYIEGELRNKILLPTTQEVERYSKNGTAGIDDATPIQIRIFDPAEEYFQYIDTLYFDNQNINLPVDLIPNIELEFIEGMEEDERPYDNFLHYVKHRLISKDSDVERIAERTGKRWQHVRWADFPIDIFHNSDEAPNDNYRNSLIEFAEEVNSETGYRGYEPLTYVNLVERVPDLGGELDYSQESSWHNVNQIWRVVNGDSLIVPINGEIYINNNIRNSQLIKGATYHEGENFVICGGRDSANIMDIGNPGNRGDLSNNDKMLLRFNALFPPNSKKLVNHRPNQ